LLTRCIRLSVRPRCGHSLGLRRRRGQLGQGTHRASKVEWSHFGGRWWVARDASACEVVRGTVPDTQLAGPDGEVAGWEFRVWGGSRVLAARLKDETEQLARFRIVGE
jgi:hypothetical protein